MTGNKIKGNRVRQRDNKKVLQGLFEISEAITSSRSLEELYASIQVCLGHIFDLKQTYIILCDPDKNNDNLIPYFLEDTTTEHTIYLEETLALSRRVISRKSELLFIEKEIETAFTQQERKTIKTISKVWLGAPLLMGKQVFGVMAVSNQQSVDNYLKEDLNLLKMISRHVATAIARRKSDKIFLEENQILQQILESSPVGIALVQNRVFKWVNDKMVTMFGYSSKKELENKSVRMIYCNQRDYELAGKMIFYGLTSSGNADYEIHLVKKDGTLFESHIRLNSAELSNLVDGVEANPMSGTIASISDISQRKASEITKSEKEKLKGVLEIAETVCHEIDQPLQNITKYINQYASKKNLVHEEVQNLRLQALAIGKITKRLTNITRYNTSKFDKNLRMVDIWGDDKKEE